MLMGATDGAYKKPAGRGRVGDKYQQLLPHALVAEIIIMLMIMRL
jgi:hypothetical protein